MEKKSVFDQVEITRSAIIQFRIALMVVDGDEEITSQWHRTALEPGQSLDEQMALVNADLAMKGYPPISPEAIEAVRGYVDITHTPAVIAAFEQAKADAQAEKEALRNPPQP